MFHVALPICPPNELSWSFWNLKLKVRGYEWLPKLVTPIGLTQVSNMSSPCVGHPQMGYTMWSHTEMSTPCGVTLSGIPQVTYSKRTTPRDLLQGDYPNVATLRWIFQGGYHDMPNLIWLPKVATAMQLPRGCYPNVHQKKLFLHGDYHNMASWRWLPQHGYQNTPRLISQGGYHEMATLIMLPRGS